MNLFRDLRFALRSLARRPLFTLTSVSILAVGLAASLLVFSWIYSMVWRPYPAVKDGRSLRIVLMQTKQGQPMSLDLPDFFDLRRAMMPLAKVGAEELEGVSWEIDGVPSRAFAGIVSSNYFDMLGLKPERGRFFVESEDHNGGAPTAVLSDKTWRRKFGADPGVLNRTITINKHTFTIIGVAPRGFIGTKVGLSLDLWVPLGVSSVVIPWASNPPQRGNHWIQGLARLAPGVSPQTAEARADVISKRLAATYPDSNRNVSFRLMSLVDSPWGATHFMAPVLAIVGAMVLLVVFATALNVAGLLLVRSRERRRELAIRMALGAGRRRLLVPLVLENLILALAALALGSAVLPASKALFLSFLPPVPVPVDPTMAIGGLGIAFGILVAVGTAIVTSLGPALDQRRVSVEQVLREESQGAGGRSHRRFRDLLVIVQVALGLVLLATGALFLRAVGVGEHLSPGFRSGHLLLADIDIFPLGYDTARGKQFLSQLRDRIAADPQVIDATMTRRVPLDLGGSGSATVSVEGYEFSPDESKLVRLDQVGLDFFKTLGIPLLAGRPFTPQEVAGSRGTERVAIVSQAMARRYWKNGQALGGTMRVGSVSIRVVGIAGDVPWQDRDEAPRPFFYLPLGQNYRPTGTLIVRTHGDPLAFAPRLRKIVAAADPGLPLSAVKSMGQHLEISLIKQRLAATMLGTFGVVALLLAVVGLYGVVALTLRQRMRELALRAALGATPSDLVRLTVRRGLRNAAIGLALGAVLAAGLATMLRSLLLGLPAFDPVAWCGALVLLAAGTTLASWLPAHRAARIDPMEVLRYE